MTTLLQESLFVKLSGYADSAVYRRGSERYIAIGIVPAGQKGINVNAVTIKSDRSVSFFTRDVILLNKIGLPFVPLKNLPKPPSKPYAPRDEDGYNFAELTIEFIEAHEEDFKKLVQDSIKIITDRHAGK